MQKEKLNQLKLQAEQGDMEALFQLGEYYFDKSSDADTEEMEDKFSAECIKWYTQAAKQGHATAQRYLGEFHETGICAEEDDRKAARWYRLAAEQGDITAQYRLADLLLEGGWNLDADEEEAVKWFTRAAEQGDADSQFSLGEYYYDEEEDEEAVKWLKLAATQGHVEAQCLLGECYSLSEIVNDEENAFHWYSQAAAQNDAEAQFQVGEYYMHGDVVEKNEYKALHWYAKAAQQGHEKALDQLAENLGSVIVTRKPRKCPVCGSTDIKTILYGMPSPDCDFSKYILGGCCVDDFSPTWGCGGCGKRFTRLPK